MLEDRCRPLYEIKATFFKDLAHPVRIRVLELLSTGQEVSVTTMLAEIGIEASHLSQHLSMLKRDQLVAAERRGSQVFYRLRYERMSEVLRASRELLMEMLGDSKVESSLVDELPPVGVRE